MSIKLCDNLKAREFAMSANVTGQVEDIYVYDFDKTIYDGDVTYDFYKYCLKKSWKVRGYFFVQIWAVFKYLLGFCKWTQMKAKMLGYFQKLDDIDSMIDQFWSEHKHKIKKWYLDKDHAHDVIISASPDILLKTICYDYLKVKLLIGTKADKKTGKIAGKNCYGNQKVERLNQEINSYNIVEFYSDSLSDAPLAQMAKKSYVVDKDDLIDWENYELSQFDKFKLLFFSRDFILFFLIGVVNTLNSVVFSLFFRLIRLDSLTAFYLGFVFSNFVAYLLNTNIIFKQKFSFARYLKFFISYIPSFLIQFMIVFVMCNILKIYDLIAYLTSAIIGVPVSFLFVRFFAFKPTQNKKIDFYLHREE